MIRRSSSSRSNIALQSPTRSLHKPCCPMSLLVSPSGRRFMAKTIRSRSPRPIRRRALSTAGRPTTRQARGSGATARPQPIDRDTWRRIQARSLHRSALLFCEGLVVPGRRIELSDHGIMSAAKPFPNRLDRLVGKAVNQMMELSLRHGPSVLRGAPSVQPDLEERLGSLPG